jgi:hypothetical protein
MKKFIFIILKFTTLIIFIISFIFWFYGQPPAKFSNSISLNSKIDFIKQKYANSNLDVLSFGSSMNLNNLSSEAIVENYGKKYLNISSWGQNMKENYNLMQVFVPFHKPNLIIISGNYMDFLGSNKNIKYSAVKKYINNNNYSNYFKNINPFNKTSIDFYASTLGRKNTFTSLDYDDYGGVNIKAKEFDFIESRWHLNERISNFTAEKKQYLYLDSIAKYCNNQDIELIYIQSPFREGVSFKTKAEEIIIKNHLSLLDSILTNENTLFINSLKKVWPDSLFLDYSHFNKEGAKQYTNFAINKIIYK